MSIKLSDYIKDATNVFTDDDIAIIEDHMLYNKLVESNAKNIANSLSNDDLNKIHQLVSLNYKIYRVEFTIEFLEDNTGTNIFNDIINKVLSEDMKLLFDKCNDVDWYKFDEFQSDLGDQIALRFKSKHL